MANSIPTLPEVLESLQRRRQNETDLGIANVFFNNAMMYLVKGKARCWWCTPETNDIATETLHLFSLAQRSPEVNEFIQASEQQLTQCTACISAYYGAKVRLRKRYDAMYSPAAVDVFFKTLEDWDAQRLVKSLAGTSIRDGAAGSIVLYDVCRVEDNLLFHPEVAAATCKYTREALTANVELNMGKRLQPGFFILAFAGDEYVRKWAWRTLKLASDKNAVFDANSVILSFAGVFRMLAYLADDRDPYPVTQEPIKRFDEISFVFSPDKVWNGLRVALGQLSKDNQELLARRLDGIPVIICKLLLDISGPEFLDTVRSFAAILSAAEPEAVWTPVRDSMACAPVDFVKLIVNHPQVRATFMDTPAVRADLTDDTLSVANRQLRKVIDWVIPFIGSLDMPKDHEAVDVLLRALFVEFPGMAGVPLACRVVAMHTTIAIVKHSLEWPDERRFLESGESILAGFLKMAAPTLLDIVQGRHELASSEFFVTSVDSFIEVILRDDMQHTFRAVSKYSEVAGDIVMSTRDSEMLESPAVLIHYPGLWDGVLREFHNTSIVKKAIFATSYILLFDPLPSHLVRVLPKPWRSAYRRFELERQELTTMLIQLLRTLCDSLPHISPEEWNMWKHGLLPSLLRHLISSNEQVRTLAMRVLRWSPTDVIDVDNMDQAGSSTLQSMLDDTECDMACYELYKQYSNHFFAVLADISNDCTILVKNERPAFSASTNVAVLVQSSVSSVSNKQMAGNTEAMAKLFFTFCNLLASILSDSSEGGALSENGSGVYSSSVRRVFQTLYYMLNTVEFSTIVQFTKNSSSLNENEAMDMLSKCVSQMLHYLGTDDTLDVSSGIIKTLGMIATGLAATPGTSMLYPKETMEALVSGKQGTLTADMRRRLGMITEQDVWEPRSIEASRARPVQIIFDDEYGLADLSIYNLSDIDDEMLDEAIPVDPKPAPAPVRPSIDVSSSTFLPNPQKPLPAAIDGFAKFNVEDHDVQPRVNRPMHTSSMQAGRESSTAMSSGLKQAKSLQEEDGNDDNVKVIQLTAEDVPLTRRKQSSMDHWLSKAKAMSKSSTLTGSKPAVAKKEPKKSGGKAGGGLLGMMKSSFVTERKSLLSSGSRSHNAGSIVPKQRVKAPRSMSTVPVHKWDSRRKMDLEEDEDYDDGKPMPEIVVRNASKEALREIELSKSRGVASSNSSGQRGVGSRVVPGDDDSVSSDGDDDDDDEGDGSGLAGLMKIHRTPNRAPERRPIKFISLSEGLGVPGASGHFGTVFFDAQARQRAISEQEAKERLTPSMSKLHKKLLAWKYEDSGDMPPDARTTKYVKIPDTFPDCDGYAKVFEPLLLLECWAQFQRSKEETAESKPCEATLLSRMCVDEFQDITFEVAIADMEGVVDHDVLVFTESLSREKRYAKGMPMVGLDGQISKRADTGSATNPAFQNKSTILGKVQSRVFGRNNVQVVVRVFMQGARLAQFLNKLVLKSVWEFIKLYGLTPMHREYAALRSLPYLDKRLVQEILTPRPGAHQMLGRLEIEKCMRMHALNQPQAEAVVAAVSRSNGFTLIQGPPGTGKTKTILGLAGALISQAKKQVPDDSYSNRYAEPDSDAPRAAKKNNKLLICAPSNAAVDEIVKRLKQGIRDDSGRTFFPSVVRVGMSDSVSSTVRDTTLDFLLDKALNSYGSLNGTKGGSGDEDEISEAQGALLTTVTGHRGSGGKVVDMAAQAKNDRASAVETQRSLRKRLDDVNVRRRELDQRMQDIDPSNMAEMRQVRQEFGKLNEEKKRICAQLDSERERGREAARTIDATKHKIRLQILQTTDILCCTLSGSGHDMMTSIQCTFDTVIIDEAAQSVELACLIPLKYGCQRCILVGDPNQLPPTVLSQTAMQHMYNQSMFVRIQKNSPESVNLLSIQYRMHPEISRFPSALFYDSKLKDGPGMAKKQTAPWHASRSFPPFCFFNIREGKEESGKSHSVFNMAEARAAVQLVQHLCANFPHLPLKQTIGVITPYKQQKSTLVRQFQTCFGQGVTDAIEFNTVDGFQGQEKDIIIFSCVRAGGSGVGFLADERRMNVGLTRARKSMFVLGNSDLLVVSPLWKKLIDDAKERELLLDCKMPLFGRYPGNGTRFDNLFKDPKDAQVAAADGEGDRAEFVLEKFDDAALARANTVAAAPSARLSETSAMDICSSSDEEGEPKSSALASLVASAKRNDVKPATSQASTHKQRSTTPVPSARLPVPPTTAVAIPVGGHRPTAPPATQRQPLSVAARQKQRSSLFIPKKRGGGTHRPNIHPPPPVASNIVQQPSLPSTPCTPSPLSQTPLPPPPPPRTPSPPPLRKQLTVISIPKSKDTNVQGEPRRRVSRSRSPRQSRNWERNSSRDRSRSRDRGRSRGDHNDHDRYRQGSSRDNRATRDNTDARDNRDNRDNRDSKHRTSKKHGSSKRRRKGGLFRPSVYEDDERSSKKSRWDGNSREDMISGMFSK